MEENYRELCVALLLFFSSSSSFQQVCKWALQYGVWVGQNKVMNNLCEDPLLITYFWIISDHKLQLNTSAKRDNMILFFQS